MDFWAHYGFYLAKTLTWVGGFLLLAGGILALLRQGKTLDKNYLDIKKLNEKYIEFSDVLREKILTKSEYKKSIKAEKKQQKELEKENRKRIFLLQFHGDIKASAVCALREEITAILGVATSTDEVVVCVESHGGMVSPYGLAASQLQRLRHHQIPLTIAIDKIAASGGYLMACVANRILAAPFAIVGSIGVVVQLPNFHRLLKKNNVDFEQLTAGEFKRTLTLFGENTSKAREKMQEELEEVHTLFKTFIQSNRPQVDLAEVATGEHWLGTQALQLRLVDELTTSDDYLLNASKNADIYQIQYIGKKSLSEKISGLFGQLFAQQNRF